MEYISINKQKYKIIEDIKEGFNEEIVKEKMTDYFDNYDYIVGDWAYGKVRLKGFNKEDNKQFKKINDYKNIKDYIKKYCAYGCRYFVLEKIKD